DKAARNLGNIGACQFALHQYRLALRSFLEAHRQAEAASDRSAAASFDFNIASLYSELGELDAASEWIQGAIRRLTGGDRKNLPQILIQLATLRARQDRMPEARQLFKEGIEAADGAADLNFYAMGWNRLGEEYLKRGQLALAEGPQPGTFAVGAGRSVLGRGAARPRGGGFHAYTRRDSNVGHLSLPWARADGSGEATRGDGGSADRGSPGARLALEYATRRCRADRDGRLAGTGSFGAGGGRQPALSGDPGTGADPGDLRGSRGKPGQQPARRAFPRAHARPCRIAARLLGNAGAPAARRSAGPAHAGRTQPGNRLQCPRRTGAHGTGPGAGDGAVALLAAGTHPSGAG